MAVAAADNSARHWPKKTGFKTGFAGDHRHAWYVEMLMRFVPDRAGFLERAGGSRLAFVYREVVADTETPVSAYAKLGRGPYSFLLESVVGGDKWAAYSFVGVRPRAVVRTGGRVRPAAAPSRAAPYLRRRAGRGPRRHARRGRAA